MLRPLLSLIALVCLVESASAAGARRPNVLFICADDMRPDCVAAAGNAADRTPTLDRLAARGVLFRRAVCAYPICVVSRAEMLTGCQAFRVQSPYASGKFNSELPRWPEAMRAAGYRTFYVGKWHTTGIPTKLGYEATRGLYGSGGGKYPLTFAVDHRGVPVTGYTGWVFKDDAGKIYPERGVGLTPNISEAFADAAIELVSEADERPFFVHLNFTAPHDPRFFPRGYETSYDPAKLSPPANFAERHPFDHGNLNGRDEVLLPRPLTPELIRGELAVYYALIEHMDAQIGRIIAALESAGQAENTIIFFTSDHGMAVGSHGLLGKQNMYEHTINVPLIAAGPGIAAGRETAAQCYLRDLFPTVCELCGIAAPREIDGRSFAEVLKRPEAKGPHDYVIGYFTDTQRMIRGERYKLIRYPQIGREQLFDVVADPYELHDLGGEAQSAAIRRELGDKLTAWLREHGDPLEAKSSVSR